MPRAVILTALSVEYQAVRNYLKHLHDEMDSQGTRYQRGEFIATNGQLWEVGIVQMGAGPVGAAMQTGGAIAYFNPDVIFLTGIAGGIKDVNIGDVVAATEVYNYESGKLGEQFFTRPKTEKSTHAVVEIAKQEAEKPDWLERLSRHSSIPPRVFVAPIAAGEKVVASRQSDVFQFLRTNFNDAIAVEMEGFGFLRATFAHTNIQAIVIRGISDLVDGKNDAAIESAEVRQEKASLHASAFTFQVLSKLKLTAHVVANRHEIITTKEQFFIEQVGRIKEERKILEILMDMKSHPAIGIWGMGGIGKTRIAREIASRCKEENIFKLVWISPDQIGIKNTGSNYSRSFETALDRIASILDRSDLTRLEGEKKSYEIKGLLNYNRVLLVFDNMETCRELIGEDQDKIARDLISLFSNTISKIIFTTRVKFSNDIGVVPIKLQGLDVDGGISLIRKISETKKFEEFDRINDSTLASITRKLGGLPLALNLAISQIAGALDFKSALKGFENVVFDDADDDYSKFYKDIFLNSWNLISYNSRIMLSVLAERKDGQSITKRYLKSATDFNDIDFNKSIMENWKYAFIEIQKPIENFNNKNDTYSLHSLTRNFVRIDKLKIAE